MPSLPTNRPSTLRAAPEAQTTSSRPARAGRNPAGRASRSAAHHDSPTRYDAGQIVLFFMLGFGCFGAIAGFLIGLSTYIPTAPVAAVELGVPAAALGGLVGVAVVATRAFHRRLTRRSRPGA